MSRRKQENPQPRKRLVNSLEEPSLSTTSVPTVVGTTESSSPQQQQLCQDILVCGVCHREFALSDILKFISHKVNSCSNKENCRIGSYNNNGSDDDIDDNDDEVPVAEDGHRNADDAGDANESDTLPVINLRKHTPSIISSSQRHKLKLRHHHTHHHRSQQNVLSTPSRLPPPCSSPAPGEKQTVDAHTNTINTEPISQMCSTCKQIFNTSWGLIQHAQHIHGLKIYVDIFSSEPNILPPIDGHHSHMSSGSGGGGHTSSSQSIISTLPSHPSALQLLRMPLSERQFPVQSFIAAAAAAAAGRTCPSGTSHGHGDLFGGSTISSTMNHHNAGIFPDAHNFFNATAADSTTTIKSSGGSGRLSSTSSLTVPPPPLTFDSHLDFYSQRLRQLAGATSPASSGTAPVVTTASPGRKLTPPYLSMSSSTTRSSPTVPMTTPTLLDRSTTPTALQSSQPLSPKTKSCEFCGKSFRFMSNLIVHRRSHTGEKPFKCHICNHACTQASKLKRHMKTHSRGRNNTSNSINNTSSNVNCSENTTDSAHSMPDSSVRSLRNNMSIPTTTNGGDLDIDDDDDIDEDEDIEDEDEDVDDDVIGDDVDNGETSRSSSIEMVAEDLSRTTGVSNGNAGKSRAIDSNGNGPSSAAIPTRTTSAMQSLLGEVMEKIGLNDIQQYNEAYKQALEESVKNVVGTGIVGTGIVGTGPVKQERPSSSSSHISSENNSGNLSINNILKHHHHTHHGLSPHCQSFNDLVAGIGVSGTSVGAVGTSTASTLLSSAFEHHNPFDPKRLKLDFSAASSEQRDSLYAGLWLPSVAANPFASFAHHISADSVSTLSAADLVRNKVVESAFNKTSSSISTTSGSPRPGPSNSSRNLSTPPSSTAINSNNSRNTSPTTCGGHHSGTPPSHERRKDHPHRSRNDTCEYCGKVFKNCSNLTVHRRSHTGEKPYKCELCSYACAQSSKLTRHMKTHGRLGKDVYKCRFCDMPFSVPSTLEKHMRKCVVNQNSNANIAAGANSDMSLVALHHTSLSNTSACSNDRDSDS